jgi:hypothetical protein
MAAVQRFLECGALSITTSALPDEPVESRVLVAVTAARSSAGLPHQLFPIWLEQPSDDTLR